MTRLALDSREFQIMHHIDCGVALMRCNRQAQAVLEFNAVLQLDPANRYARWNRALAYLTIGNYQVGFKEHDWAWEVYDWRALGPVEGNVDRILALPLWQGQRCRLIVYHEMGNGDAIMLLRFLEQIVSRCWSVTLVVRPELVSLMEGRGAKVVGAVPEDCSGFDARITFFNSMHVLGHTRDTIPSKPYLPVDFRFTGGKLGIAWFGNSQKAFQNISRFLRMLDTSGFEVYAMQKDRVPEGIAVRQLEAKSFKETAALMATMDAVVTVDTAAAHLAGAMGHPNAHVVMPYLRDWRWHNKDAWYPTLNIYPQDDPGDWDTPFEKINRALHNG